MDEPSLGLAPAMVKQVFELLPDLHTSGVSILLVDHNARMALEVADPASVPQAGRVVASGSAAALAADDTIRIRIHHLGVSTA